MLCIWDTAESEVPAVTTVYVMCKQILMPGQANSLLAMQGPLRALLHDTLAALLLQLRLTVL